MNKISDGKSSFQIDLKKLFANAIGGRRFNGKMLLIRCLACAAAVALTVILTLAAAGAFKQGGDDSELGNFSESETSGSIDEGETNDETESESEQITQVISNEDESAGYTDLSYKEHGELYVINKTGDPIVYDPYADYDSYYDKNDLRPLVLILHTDDEQKYTGDEKDIQSIVSIGEKIAEQLNISGIPTIHCSARHRGDTDTDSYNNAEESIEFYLEMYPSIKYIFDIGIDGENNCITRGEYDNSDSAQILFDVCGQNYDTREQNLHLAVKLRGMLNRGNMSVAREIILSRSILNSRFTPYYLTVKIGTEKNTSKEAKNSANAFVRAFTEYLNKQ